MANIYSSLTEIKSGLQRAEITVEGLVKGYLLEIEKNAHLNAFNEVFKMVLCCIIKKMQNYTFICCCWEMKIW
jgi:aspartyl-tRNA(Asn)/glutamyl-tRNA(Gln) amidotransferase subunit A